MDLSGLAPIRKLDIGILRQALNTDNLSTKESEGKGKSTELLPEIFRLLASLEDDTQKMLLDSWAKLEMPLNEKTVSQLLQYLDGKPASNSEDKMAVIKAFAFLESNGLPFSEKLVDALRSVFNKNGSLAAKLENYLNSNNSLTQSQLENLLKDLNLNKLKNSIFELNNLKIKSSDNNNSQNNLNQNSELLEPKSSKANYNSTQNLNSNLETIDLNDKTVKANLLNNFNNLDQEIKNIILNNLSKLGKNFDENTIKILNNYLAANQITDSSEKEALLKSFAFLENNKLALNENLINRFKLIFGSANSAKLENFLEQLDSKNTLFENLNQNQSSIINKNESVLELATAPEKIAEKLSDFTKLSDQVISLFNKSGGENEQKIADNLLGQKLVNLQQQEQNSPLMLALELPVELTENNISSLMLKIENQNENQEEKTKNGYNISFILEFEKIGPIQSKININNNQLNTSFFTESAETAELIKNNFPLLKSALNNKGFKINSLSIKNFDNFQDEKELFFNNNILNELNQNDSEGKYRHIDIKI